MKKIIGIAFVLTLLCLSIASAADKVWFSAEEGQTLTLDSPPLCTPCEDPTICPDPIVCPDPEPPVVEFLPSPGNAHGVNHGNRVKREGITACTPCHNGKDAVVVSDRFICSQYDFQPVGRKVSDGNGGFVKDPMSGNEITSGTGIAVLLKGDIIKCKTCHYPHATPGFKAEDYLVHQGCLECHVRVGSGDLIGSNDEDNTPVPPTGEVNPTGFKEMPWQNLCNNCHSSKSWVSESHKKHAEKRIACTNCHTTN